MTTGDRPDRRSTAEERPGVAESPYRAVLALCDDPRLRTLLEEAPCEVVESAPGAPGDSLDLLATSDADLLIIDGTTERERCLELCRRARSRFTDEELPIVTVLFSRDSKALSSAFEAGASEVLSLPADLPVLRHRLHHLARSKRIAAELRRSQSHLRNLVYYDSLTGLPNRLRFRETLDRSLRETGDRTVAVMVVDIDRFKQINDSLGHGAGDEVLRVVAERLAQTLSLGTERAAASEARSIARQGGDQFILAVSDLDRVGTVAGLARDLLRCIERPIEIGDSEVFLTGSIGAAVSPSDGDNADRLIRSAETAMYAAKRAGRGTFRFFTSTPSRDQSRRFALANQLRRALEREELALVYQPIVDAQRQTVTGLEALLRWSPQEGGPVQPAEFIPLAEEIGLIVPIGEWVLRRACADGRRWNERARHPLRVAVNVSGLQLRDRSFVGRLSRILEETGLDPRLLELEITESSVVESERETLSALHQLKVQGIRLAVDDFGTGHSVLSYLKRFPLSTLKIDQSFTRGIAVNADDAAIVTATVRMAHGLNMRVVAEGVEYEEQLAFLAHCQCDEVQGFLFGAPQPGKEVDQLLDGERLER